MTALSRETLPLESTPALCRDGWSVCLRVRAEKVTLDKQTVVRERVLVKRKRVEEVARVDASVRREQLQTTTSGRAMVRD